MPPPLTSDVHQPPSASIRGLFSCLCCIAFARQFPLLSMGHCSFLLLYLPLFTRSLCLSSLGPSFSSSSTRKIPLFFRIFSSPPPLLNMALTGGEAGLFLHVCQVLFLLPADPPSFPDLCIAVWLCMNSAQLSVIPSFLLSLPPSLPPLGVVSGVGPSLCAKVPPVYRAPDFPPALLSIGLLWFDFFFYSFF